MASSAITPFWNRIPQFFLYGLRTPPLILAGALFVASYLFSWPLLTLVFYVVIIKYSAEALQRTVEGDLSPPKLSVEVVNDNLELPFKLFVVYLCYFYALGYLLAALPWLLAIPLLVLAIVLLPAVVISLVITEEIGAALNPAHWFSIAMRIGWPYLIMFGFLLAFSLVQSTFTSILAPRISPQFILPLLVALETYFTVVIFHLMGYVVMQYHEELGAEPPGDHGSAEESHSEHTTPLLERFIEEGNVDAAIAELSSLIEANPEDLELRRRMYVFLRSHGKEERLKRYAPHYYGMLTAQRRHADAASVYLDSHERGEPFSPEVPAHYLPVMRELRQRCKSKEAVLLAQGFHKRFPNDPHTPEIYLEMAKVLSEDLQRDDLARNILGFLLQGFAGNPLVPEVEQYLGLLDRLGGKKAPAG